MILDILSFVSGMIVSFAITYTLLVYLARRKIYQMNMAVEEKLKEMINLREQEEEKN